MMTSSTFPFSCGMRCSGSYDLRDVEPTVCAYPEDGMLLAELEVFHSRPIAPTRRVALGNLLLPCDPSPILSGVLLGAVAARFTPELDPDMIPDLVSLTHEVEAGRRIPQPRLRHRFQQDRVGLTRSAHRLFRHEVDGELSLSFSDDKGLPGQMVLGAIYASQTLPIATRGVALSAVRRGIAWNGEIDAGLLAVLSGSGVGSIEADALTDPVGWALGKLGFDLDSGTPARSAIQRSYRQNLIDAHPDHGGSGDDAAARIAEITQARRILLAS